MANHNSGPIKPTSPGFLGELSLRVRLALRLMADRRVSPFVKILPVFSLVYLFVPDLVIGPLDDAAVVGIAFTVFVELCPPGVVEEHLRALRGQGKSTPGSTPKEEDILEGEFQDVSATGTSESRKDE